MGIWDSKADLILISTYGVLTSKVALVGFPYEARWPGISQKLGMFIKMSGNWDSIQRAYCYHLLVSRDYPKSRMGLFQIGYSGVPHHTILGVSFAVTALWMSYHPEAKVALEIPLIPETTSYTRQLKDFGVELWDSAH